MHTNFPSQLLQTLREVTLMDPSALKYVLAVSGGRDSMIMLHLFHSLFKSKNLIIAHFNHNVRGKESQRDERFVKAQAKKIGVTFTVQKQAVAQKKMSENALRNARYAFLNQVYKDHNAHFIVTAHHAQDQIETLMMRLMRGFSSRGFLGMQSLTGNRLKPMLGFLANEMNEYASFHKLKYRFDSSNNEDTYLRNVIRNRLLPEFFSIASDFGSEKVVTQRILKNIDEVNSVLKLKNILIAPLLEQTTFSPWFIRIPLKAFENCSEILMRAWAEHALTTFGFSQRLESRYLDAFQKSYKASIKRTSMGRDLFWMRSQGYGYFYSSQAMEKLSKSSPKQAGFSIKGKSVNNTEWRFAKAGDKFRTTSLAKIFNEWKVPELERRLIPVLAVKKSSVILEIYPAIKSSHQITPPFRLAVSKVDTTLFYS